MCPNTTYFANLLCGCLLWLQERMLALLEQILEQCVPTKRRQRDFHLKFPDDIVNDTMTTHLLFAAEVGLFKHLCTKGSSFLLFLIFYYYELLNLWSNSLAYCRRHICRSRRSRWCVTSTTITEAVAQPGKSAADPKRAKSGGSGYFYWSCSRGPAGVWQPVCWVWV